MDKIFGPQLRFERSTRAGFNDMLPAWPWLTRLGALFFMHAPSWMLQPLIKSLLIANMSPSQELFSQGAVLVDTQGRRLQQGQAAISVAMTQERAGYIVMPAAVAEKFRAHPFYISTAPGIAYAYLGDYERGRPDIVHWAGSQAALAKALGMDEVQLAAACGSAAEVGPWLALGPVRAMLTTTEGAVCLRPPFHPGRCACEPAGLRGSAMTAPGFAGPASPIARAGISVYSVDSPHKFVDSCSPH